MRAYVVVQVRVYWPQMGKWYFGKVVSYDNSTGMHKVHFKDGDSQSLKVQQEAVVWLDIPELSTDTALRKVHSEEGVLPIAIIG